MQVQAHVHMRMQARTSDVWAFPGKRAVFAVIIASLCEHRRSRLLYCLL